MPLARVVSFEGVSSDRMAQMKSEMEGSDRPDNIPAKEIVVLHDPEAESGQSKSLVGNLNSMLSKPKDKAA